MEYTIVILAYILLIAMMHNCNKNNLVSNLKIQPPSIIFSMIWPLIYLLIWLSSNEYELNYYYYLLLLSFFLWPLSYVCYNYKLFAIFAILISLSLALVILTTKSPYIAPVIAWLIYALILNCFELQFS
jgi:tryptophan-rich sensory protein